MKKQFGTLAGLCLLYMGIGLAGSGLANAQDAKPNLTPPNVLVVQREVVKPGMSGRGESMPSSDDFTRACSPSRPASLAWRMDWSTRL